jgi:hypothetical protein
VVDNPIKPFVTSEDIDAYVKRWVAQELPNDNAFFCV